ncbi:PAS and helix-turn-helix domain-containing protein [Ruegeria profundi]|uniref:PAS and helix-turn-helix domain-containing protein n=1 Tax=Ruegeria profundi TaxID=1685378 RepID=UPI000B0106C0|nr:PAS and helix-turn-helix domain-containing protein [Ruegeria profundi]
MTGLADIAFENAPVGLIYSEDRIIRRCNPSFAEMFGYHPDELHNTSLSRLYPSVAEFDHIGRVGLRKMVGGGRYADERIMRRASGELFWCRVRGQSLTPDTPFNKAVWTFSDLSEVRPSTGLTLRERQVAKLMIGGVTTKEIAHELGISPRTAEVHRARLLKKMDAKNGLELVARLVGIPL